jgi:hypothetical protein
LIISELQSGIDLFVVKLIPKLRTYTIIAGIIVAIIKPKMWNGSEYIYFGSLKRNCFKKSNNSKEESLDLIT